MQVASDILYGAVIAGVILLIVLSLKFRGEQSAIETTQFRAAKIAELSLVEAIERDFTNVGSELPPPDAPWRKPEDSFVYWDTLASPAKIAFWAQTDSTLQAERVCYTWNASGRTVQLKSGTVPLLTVQRRTGVDASCNGGIVSGQSTNMITRFEIHLLRADSLSFTNLSGPSMDIKQLLVRLRAVSPLGPGETLEETRWEKMFRPVNLWKRREV